MEYTKIYSTALFAVQTLVFGGKQKGVHISACGALFLWGLVFTLQERSSAVFLSPNGGAQQFRLVDTV